MDSLPQLKVNIVAGGVDDVKTAFRSVQEAAEGMSLRIRQTQQTNAQKVIEIERNKANQIKKISENTLLDDEQKKAKQKEIEEKFSSQLVSLKEREQLRINQIMERGFQQRARLEERERARHAEAQKGRLGILATSLGGSLGGLSGAFDMAGGSAASGLVGGGMGGLALGAGVVAGLIAIKEAFEVVSFAAHSFAGAILEIGGGLSAQKSIVDAARNQRTGVQIAAALNLAGENVSAEQVGNIINQGALNSEFSREQLGKGVREYVSKTGSLNGLGSNINELSKIASVTETPIEDLLSRFGNLKSQFAGLDDKQLLDLFRRFTAQGAKGTVELRDLQGLGQATGYAGMMSGDIVENIARIGAGIQVTAPGMGGTEEAVTGQKQFINQLFKLNAAQRKQIGLQVKNGKIMNYEEALENSVALMATGKAIPKPLEEVRAGGFLRSVGVKSGAFEETGTGDFKATSENMNELRNKVRETMDSFAKANITTEDVDKQFEKVSQTIEYQLKKSFNTLSTTIGDKVLPEVAKFASYLSDNSEKIGTAIEEIIEYLIAFGEGLLGFLNNPVIKSMAESFIVSPKEKAVEKAQEKLTKYDQEHQGMGIPANEDEREKLIEELNKARGELSKTKEIFLPSDEKEKIRGERKHQEELDKIKTDINNDTADYSKSLKEEFAGMTEEGKTSLVRKVASGSGTVHEQDLVKHNEQEAEVIKLKLESAQRDNETSKLNARTAQINHDAAMKGSGAPRNGH